MFYTKFFSLTLSFLDKMKSSILWMTLRSWSREKFGITKSMTHNGRLSIVKRESEERLNEIHFPQQSRF